MYYLVFLPFIAFLRLVDNFKTYPHNPHGGKIICAFFQISAIRDLKSNQLIVLNL